MSGLGGPKVFGGNLSIPTFDVQFVTYLVDLVFACLNELSDCFFTSWYTLFTLYFSCFCFSFNSNIVFGCMFTIHPLW